MYLKYLINNLLGRVGYRIISTDIEYDQRHYMHQLVEIDIENCVDLLGRSYRKNGENHWVRLLNEYAENPYLTWDKSYLNTHFNNFTVEDANRCIFGSNKTLRHTFAGKPIFPWTPFRTIEQILSQQERKVHAVTDVKARNDHFGPSDAKFIADEFDRTIKIYDLVKNNGYTPEKYLDKYGEHPYSWGVLLKDKNDIRMVIVSGKHKLSSLSSLGTEKILVKFWPYKIGYHITYPTIIDISNIHNWPCVNLEILSKNEAEKIFYSYFYQ